MRNINMRLAIAIIWFLVAIYFFCIGKIWVGVIWLVVGVLNLFQGIRIFRANRKIQNVIDLLDEQGSDETNNNKSLESIAETIELSKDMHTIFDEHTGYGYVVNKAFKQAKSHTAEIELLCTYAPKDEYGKEGEIPYIAVQIDDAVYCAIEEYKENRTFADAICIEPLDGLFLFKAKKEYYENIMYFYGFELERAEYLDKAGLCMVYPKEYMGTENEKILMNVLDEAANNFKRNL